MYIIVISYDIFCFIVFQSVVLISRLPYVNLFSEVVSLTECCILFMSPLREGTAVGEGRKEVEAREWGYMLGKVRQGVKGSGEARGRRKEGTEMKGLGRWKETWVTMDNRGVKG